MQVREDQDSEDHGRTWHCSQPFPVGGTGEGAVAELFDGRVYYSSRRHRFGEDEPFRNERLRAWSHDGGATWPDRVDIETDAGEYSYPAIVATSNGVALTWTWNRRRIAFAEIDASALPGGA